ncbi:universal stress protein [Frankia sp. CcWB3]
MEADFVPQAEIVVGIDGSADAERALRWAVDAARLRDARVRAVLVWAAAGPPHERSKPPSATSPEHPCWTAQWLLHDVVERVRKDEPAARIFERTVYGAPVQMLLAESDRAAMLVLGAHGASRTQRRLTGSVSLACVHDAAVPVVVVHGERGRSRPGPVVVGVDGSAASVDALAWAAGEAAMRRAPLRVVHVWEPLPATLTGRVGLGDEAFRDAAQAVLDESANAGLAGWEGIGVETGLIVGNAAYGLINAAARAQLLVVGARGRGGFAELLLGSTSSQCVLHAACPVAVVRPPRRRHRS